MSIALRLLPLILSILVSLDRHTASGALVNVTVDDQGADSVTGKVIGYEGLWKIQPGCVDCDAMPNPENAQQGTWHDAPFDVTEPPVLVLSNATFSFTGTAIYVFGMVDTSFGIDLVFYLDEEVSGHYTNPQSGLPGYSYHQLYFQAQGLQNIQHTIKLQNGRLDQMQPSVALFDYLVYTRDDSNNGSSAATSLEPAAIPSFPASSTAHPSVPAVTSASVVSLPVEQPTDSSKKLSMEPSTTSSTPIPTLLSTQSSTTQIMTPSSLQSMQPSATPSTLPDTETSTMPSTTPFHTAALSTAGNHTGLSSTTRAAIIAVAAIVLAIIAALLGLLYRAHRNRLQHGDKAPNPAYNSVYGSVAGHDAPYTAMTAILMAQHFASAYGTLVNITIDDQGHDPMTGNKLSRTSGISLGQTCGSACDAQPDPLRVFNGTWMDTTFIPGGKDEHGVPQSVTFSFTGTAVYVYGIQSQSINRPGSDADVLFYIDGAKEGNYKFTAKGPQSAYTYNQLLFSADDFDDIPHTLMSQNGRIGGGSTLLLLDFIVYTSRICHIVIVTHDIYTHDIYAHDIYTHDIYTHDIYTHDIYTHDIYTHDIYTHDIYTHV
ncbi:hypothetical protein PsYK624_054340 [Phanerochaete sordida]|uniref:Uncharacterized protein n=1 Tax=Phanerochaete sordida TaxID=48140 RepID=A0A9P3LBL7_9APHY|nr:hypothetical protein PsYK624_054340 [Phanerochaete sordida]